MDVWNYIDAQGAVRGPVPASVLCKLIEKGLIVDGTTHVWKKEIDTWKPMSEVSPFKEEIEFSSRQWFFMDQSQQQKGPLVIRGILEKARNGQIDGFTKVWREGMSSWMELSQVEELKQRIAQAAPPMDEQTTETEETMEPQAFEEQMVWVGDEEGHAQHIQQYLNEKKQKQQEGDEGKKRFVANDGSRLVWDDEKQEWMEGADEPSDDENDQDDNDAMEGKGAYAESSAVHENTEQRAEGATSDTEDVMTTATASTSAAGIDDQQKKKKKKKSKKKRAADWAEKVSNNWVYITGLPVDITEEELLAHLGRAGAVAINPATGQPKVKIYSDEEHKPKGDASVCFLRPESVDTCVNIFDGGFLRPGVKLSMSKAQFKLKGEFNESFKRVKVTGAQVKVARAVERQSLAWAEDDDTGIAPDTSLKIVVIENMFSQSDFSDPNFEAELERDIATECSKLGPIDKITLFSSNPRGVVVIKYSTAYAAMECTKRMNGRFFAGRQLRSYFWDGVTDFTVRDENEELKQLDAMGDWLDQQEVPAELQLKGEGGDQE